MEEDVKEKLRLADEAWDSGDVERALDYLIEALEIEPDNKEVILKSGKVLIELEQIESAKNLYESYLKKHPEDEEIKNAIEKMDGQEKLTSVCEKLLIAVNLVPFKDKEQLERQNLCIQSISNLKHLNIELLNICYLDELIKPDGWYVSPILERSADKLLNIHGKRKPFVKDLFNIACQWAKNRNINYFVITNSDIIFTEKLINRIRELIEKGYENVAVSRHDILNFDRYSGRAFGYIEFLGFDVFICKTSWWLDNSYKFNDYIFGERAWDNIYAAIMANNSRFEILIEEGLCFHLKHPETWVSGPYSDYNMSLFSGVDKIYGKRYTEFLNHVRSLPKERLTNEFVKELYKKYFISDYFHDMGKIIEAGEKDISINTHCLDKFTGDKEKTDLTSIIIFSSNNKGNLKRCLKNIKKHTSGKYEVLVLADMRTGECDKVVRKVFKDGDNCRIIKIEQFNEEKFQSNYNLEIPINFSYSVNKGINESSGEYILVMTDDVIVTEGWLDGMLNCINSLENPGVIGPITNIGEPPQKVLGFEHTSMEDINEFAKKFSQRNKFRKVLTRKIEGFCMLFKRDFIEKIGMFDEGFEGTYHYVDEDICLRAMIDGYTNAIAGDVFVYRDLGQDSDYMRVLNRVISKNKRYFGRKWSDVEELTPKWKKLLTANALSAGHDFIHKGIHENAAAVLLEALKHSKEDSRLHFLLIDTLIDRKKYIDAISILETMPDIFKNHPKRFEYLAVCKEAVGNYKEAELYADEALKYNAKSPVAMNVKGIIAYKNNDIDKAMEHFEKAIEYDPSYGEPLANIGAIKWSQNKKEDAFNDFLRAFTLTPYYEDITMNLYNAGIGLSKLDAIEEAFKDAISVYPLNRRLRFLLIDILIQEGKYHEAMDMFEDFMLDYGFEENILKTALSLRDKIGPIDIDKKDKETISLCMIAKNEEVYIGSCLKKIKPLVDEMIVVDTGSNDMTKDIAKAFGAKVYDFQWNNNFSDARNFSIEKATGKWILVLDADEVIAQFDFERLKRLIKDTKDKVIAYSFVTRNYVKPVNTVGWVGNDGSYLKEEAGTGWYMSEKVRLFPNDKRLRFERPVHELIEYTAIRHGITIKKCDVPIHHYGKMDVKKVTNKGRDYYELGKIKLAETGEKNLVAVFELGIQASELGLHEEAIEHWRKAIEIEPKFPKAYYGLGSSLFTLERYIEAYPALRKAVHMQPDDRDAVVLYSTCELYFGNAKVQIPILESLLDKAPEFLRALLILGACYFCADMDDKGMQVISKLDKMGVNYSGYYSELSKELFKNKRYHFATKVLSVLKDSRYYNDEVKNRLDEYRKKAVEDIEKTALSDKPEISLCMIVKDEEKNIIKCLSSVKPLVEEIIVVDTGSTDNTKKIAESFGAKVYDFSWNNNFSDARNFSIEKANGKWILVLDADEVIATTDHDFLKTLVKNINNNEFAFSLITRNYVNQINTMGWVPNDGKYIEEAGTGWYYGEKVRLFPNIDGVRFEDPVHERIEPSLERLGIKVIDTYIPVHHYGELDTEKVKSKDEYYYELGKKRLLEKGGLDIKALYDLGVQASRLERYDEAIEYFNKIIELDPKYMRAYESMGNAYYNKGDYEKANEFYKRVINKDIPSRELLVMSANCEIFTGNPENAINILQRLLEKEPTYPLAMFVYCIAFFVSGMKEQGNGLLNTLITMSVFSLRDFIGYARILISFDRYDYALRILMPLKERGFEDKGLEELIEVCRKKLRK